MSGKHIEHAADAISVPTGGETLFLFRAQKLPGDRIRLYATRDIPSDGWGQRELEDGREVVWHLEADMRNVLIVDRGTIGECVAWVLERWMREDADKLAESVEPGYRERVAAREPRALEPAARKPSRRRRRTS